MYRQVRCRRPPRPGRGGCHRLHRDSVGVRRPRLRRPARQEDRFDEAGCRDLHPLGLAGLRVSVTNPGAPVHLAGKRSREAAIAHDKDAWLANFADDAIVEDPIGPSHFDPEGKGHRGKEAIAKFYDMAIAPSELTFNFTRTYQCGDEEANVGNIVIRSSGYEVVAEGVFTYRVNDEGQMVALRAYWELDAATKSARKI